MRSQIVEDGSQLFHQRHGTIIFCHDIFDSLKGFTTTKRFPTTIIVVIYVYITPPNRAVFPKIGRCFQNTALKHRPIFLAGFEHRPDGSKCPPYWGVLARFLPFLVERVENTPESRWVKGDETVLIYIQTSENRYFDELVYGPYDLQTGRLRVTSAVYRTVQVLL